MFLLVFCMKLSYALLLGFEALSRIWEFISRLIALWIVDRLCPEKDSNAWKPKRIWEKSFLLVIETITILWDQLEGNNLRRHGPTSAMHMRPSSQAWSLEQEGSRRHFSGDMNPAVLWGYLETCRTGLSMRDTPPVPLPLSAQHCLSNAHMVCIPTFGTTATASSFLN